MTKEIFEKLLERSILFFLSGLILFLLGATGGITIGTIALHITEIIWRIIISSLGILFMAFGVFFLWKENPKEKEPKNVKEKNQIEQTNTLSVTDLVSRWDPQSFKQSLSTAQNICMIAVSNYSLIAPNSEELKQFVQQGGKLRCIYVKPQGEAIKMVSLRNIGAESKLEHLTSEYFLAIDAFRYIAGIAPKKDQIQIKAIDYLYGVVLTLIDPHLPNGIAYITLNGFGHHYTSRPCLTLLKTKSPEWFKFFEETFENMWSSPSSESVAL